MNRYIIIYIFLAYTFTACGEEEVKQTDDIKLFETSTKQVMVSKNNPIPQKLYMLPSVK